MKATGIILLLLVALAVGIAFAFRFLPYFKQIGQEGLAYPVLLVCDGKIDEVCINMYELRLRPENVEPLLETEFSVIDSGGQRYRIRNVRPMGKRPSTMKRVFNATVYNILRFDVAFELSRNGSASEEELASLLEEAEDPGKKSLTDCYNKFRENRFLTYGHLEDRWPGTWAKTPEDEE